MKSICITGIAGFIGYHTALALSRRGDRVIGFDNFDPYYRPALKLARAAQLRDVGIEIATGNLTDEGFLRSFFSEQRPTHLLHLAAQAGVRYSLENPNAYTESNLVGFCALLEICRANPQMPLIFASSSSIYGEGKEGPLAEGDTSDQPVSLYGATKKCNEVLASAYHHLYGIRATALRLFTVYGPWGRPDMAYWIFTKALLQGAPVPLYNHGQMRRDFTYIDDLVAGILAALDLSAPLAVYNLGNSRPQTLERFLEILEQTTGRRATRALHPLPAGDVRSTWADLTLARRDLGYSPRVTLEEGLTRFVDWYRSTPEVSAL